MSTIYPPEYLQSPPQPPPLPAPPKRHGVRKALLIIGTLIVLALALAGCGSEPAVTAAPGSPAVTAASGPPAAATPTDCVTYSFNGGEVVCGAAAQASAQAAAAEQTAAAASAAASARAATERAHRIHQATIARENTLISATLWDEVIRSPANYVGDIYTISGTVGEYNINSNTFATNANAALVATDANGNDFVVEADSSLLGNVQPGQTFTAKVTVEGVDQTQNTISGGTGEVPDFLASTFTVTG
jgi:hypothetical protein